MRKGARARPGFGVKRVSAGRLDAVRLPGVDEL